MNKISLIFLCLPLLLSCGREVGHGLVKEQNYLKTGIGGNPKQTTISDIEDFGFKEGDLLLLDIDDTLLGRVPKNLKLLKSIL